MLQPGVELRRGYCIERVLGQGGMGAVYLARQSSLGRRVAIKETLIQAEDPDDRAAILESFKREAEILASLDHPHLVDVKDYFEEGGSHFLVMSYIDGATLEEVLGRSQQPLPVAQVLEWMDQVCAVLSFLHENRPPVLVRDLKPSNVMVDARGRIKLIDFGIARLQQTGQQTMAFLKGAGTVGFAPVEQFGGASTDARSDIYALGATIYYLLTSQVPPWSMQLATGEAHLIPPGATNPAIPPMLDAVILKAMALRREDRFHSAAEMRGALEAAGLSVIGSARMATNDIGHRFCTQCGTTLVPAAHSCHQCGTCREGAVPAGKAWAVGPSASGPAAYSPHGQTPVPPPAPGPADPSLRGGPPSNAFQPRPPGQWTGSLQAGPGPLPGGSGGPSRGGFYIPQGMPPVPHTGAPRTTPTWLIVLFILAVLFVIALLSAESATPHPVPTKVASVGAISPSGTTDALARA